MATAPVPPGVDEFRAAAVAAYVSAGDPARQAAAQAWIATFQRSMEAWSVADAVLATVGFTPADEAVSFAAANVLHCKIRFAYMELVPERRVPFRDRLVTHMARFKPDKAAGKNTYSTFTRLCLVLSTLAVQMKEWEKAVAHFMAMRDQQLLDNVTLLTVLTFLAEEAVAGSINAVVKVRRDFQDELQGFSEAVLREILNLMRTPDAAVVQSCLKCLEAWVHFCRIPTKVLAASGLVETTFLAMAKIELFDEAVDCVVSMVKEYYSLERHGEVVGKLVTGAMSQRERVVAAVRDGDMDTARGMTRIFAEMGETYMPVILGPMDIGQEHILNMLLVCASVPDYEIASITYKFWTDLADTFEDMPPSAVKDKRRAMLVPALTGLVDHLVTAAQFPEEYNSWTQDQQLLFRRNRRFDMTDVLSKVAEVSSVEPVLHRLATRLQAAFEEFKGAAAAAAASHVPIPDKFWRGVEVCLFCVRGVARLVPKDESKYLPGFLEFVHQMPPVELLRVTCLRVLGRFAEWMPARRGMATKAFNTIVSWGIADVSNAAITEAATDSFSYVCDFCSGELQTLPLDNIPSYQMNKMAKPQVLRMVEALGYATGRLSPPQMNDWFNKLLGSMLDQLAAANASAAASGPAAVAEQVSDLLARAGTLVRFTKTPTGVAHPITPVLMDDTRWGQLSALTDTFVHTPSVTEAVAQFHKNWLLTADEASAAVLPRLIERVVKSATVELHSGQMFLVTIALDIWGKHPSLTPMLMSAVEQLSALVLRKLGSAPDALLTNPDVVQDFFNMLIETLKQVPVAFLGARALVDPVMQCALAAMGLQQPEANSAVLLFLEHLVGMMGGEFHAAVAPLIERQAPLWVKRMFDLILSGVPRYMVDTEGGCMVGLMFKLGVGSPANLAAYMKPCLEAVPIVVMPHDEKGTFMTSFFRYLEENRIDKLAMLLRDFSQRCYLVAKGDE